MGKGASAPSRPQDPKPADMDWKKRTTLWPIDVAAVMMVSEIRVMTKPYSMIVAPRSSRVKAAKLARS